LKSDIGVKTAQVDKLSAQAGAIVSDSQVGAQKYMDESERSRVELITQRLKDLQDGRLTERKLDIEEKKVGSTKEASSD